MTAVSGLELPHAQHLALLQGMRNPPRTGADRDLGVPTIQGLGREE